MTYIQNLRVAFNFLGIAALGLAISSFAAVAQDDENLPPAFRMDQPERVSPAASDTYFEALKQQVASQPTSQSRADSRAPGPLAPQAALLAVPDMAELARSLKNDIDLIYAYVHDNIELTPTFGLKKGPIGTHLDASGNPFDQTHLFVTLARAAGFEAEYVLGDVRLTSADLNDWLGTTGNASSAAGVLTAGYIPVDDQGSYADFKHLWARVKINGTFYHFDPSLKTHTVHAPLPNLASVMGYSYNGSCGVDPLDPTCGLLTAAGGTLSGNTLTSLDDTTVESKLDGYAENLITHIRQNTPTATMMDIVGGMQIDAHQGSALRNTSHPNLKPGSVPVIWTTAIDDLYRTKLGFKSKNSNCWTGDPEFFTDEIDVSRLVVKITGSNSAEMWLDDVKQKEWNSGNGGFNSKFVACINQPYPSGSGGTPSTSNGGPGDVYKLRLSLSTVSGNTYAVLHGWGNTGSGRLEYHQKRLQQYKADGKSDTSLEVIGEALQINAVTWLTQDTSAQRARNSLFNTWEITHNSVGVAGQTTGPYVDIPGVNSTSASKDGSAFSNTETLQAIFSGTGTSSAFESTTIEQMTDVGGVSTVTFFEQANDNGVTFHDLDTAADLTAVESTLLANGYAQGVLDNIRSQLESSSIDYRFVLPEDGNMAVEQWNGHAYLTQGVGGGGIAAGFTINGAKGGFAGKLQNALKSAERVIRNTAIYKVAKVAHTRVGKLVSDPVNTYTGDYIYDTTDMTIGSRPFPHGLGFQRHYSSGANLTDGKLGYGWQHNFDIRVAKHSNSAQGLGEDSPIDAAAMIVTYFVARDLLKDGTDLKPMVLSMLVQDWGTSHLFENAVTVTLPGNSETFVRLPGDLGFNPPPKSNAKLTETITDKFFYELLDGTTLEFILLTNGNIGGNLKFWTDANGFKVTPTYDTSGRLTQMTNDFGWKVKIFYTNGRISKVSGGVGSPVFYTYYGNGNLKTFTNARGEVTTYVYDSENRMTEIKYPSFPNTPFVKNVYDSLGRVKEQTNPNTGPNDPWVYYIAGPRSEEVDPLSNSRVWIHDNEGNVVEEIDQLGRKTVNEYDGLNRRTKTTLPEGNSVSYTYDDATCITRCTHNVLSVVTTPDVSRGGPTLTESFTYWDASKKHKLKKSIDPKLNETSYDYDSQGKLISVTSPTVAGGTPVTTYEYFATTSPQKGLLFKITDPLGKQTTFGTAGNNGNNINIREDRTGLDLRTDFTYDAWGNRVTVKDPEGRQTNLLFDCERRFRASAPPSVGGGSTAKPKTRYVYDKDGRVTETALVTGSTNRLRCNTTTGAWGTVIQKWEKTYYENGLLKEDIDPSGQKTTYAYDKLDRLVTVTDPDGRIARTIYDAAGQVIRTEIEKGAFPQVMSRYEYDLNGNVLAVRDAKDNRTEYVYDGLDRLIETRFPSLAAANTSNPNDKEVLAYDANGNVTKRTTRAGQDIDFTYDALNRLTLKEPAGNQSVSYEYDLTGRQTRVSFSTGPGHVIDYGYDSAGRLTSITDDGRTVSYILDKTGLREQMTWPDGQSVNYIYDLSGRIHNIKEGTLASPGTKLIRYRFDNKGRTNELEVWNNGAAMETTYGYEPDSALDTLAHDLTAGTPATTDVTFTMDYLPGNQVSQTTISNASYVYNEPANLDYDYTSNRLNQITTATRNSGPTTYTLTYDANGNLTGDGGDWTYSYDSENRMISANKIGLSASYGYDPLGRRASKTVSGSVSEDIRYIYDGGEVIAETDASGTVLRRYVYGPGVDEPIAMYIGAGTTDRRFYVTDPQGSVIAMTDTTGALVEQYSYSAYGIPDDPDVGATGNPLRYTARRWDAETGLYFYRARMYSPTLGRFMQADPIGYDDGLNMYAYVGNDPLNFRDPSGTLAQKVQGGSARFNLTTNSSNHITQISNSDAVAAPPQSAGRAPAASGKRGVNGIRGAAVAAVMGAVQGTHNERRFFHYTTQENLEAIVESQVIVQNRKHHGVFVTEQAIGPQTVERNLFLNLQGTEGRGEAVLVIRLSESAQANLIPDPSAPFGLIYPGSMRNGKGGVEFLWWGQNIFAEQ